MVKIDPKSKHHLSNIRLFLEMVHGVLKNNNKKGILIEMVYKLEIRSIDFGMDTICMGWRLSKILRNFIDLKNIKWLVFDIYGTTQDDLSKLFEIDETGKIIFEDTETLISKVDKIIQFEQGVFSLISSFENIDFEELNLETEASEGLQIKNSLLEIRAFDYSYFEIYSNNKTYLKKIEESIAVTVEETLINTNATPQELDNPIDKTMSNEY